MRSSSGRIPSTSAQSWLRFVPHWTVFQRGALSTCLSPALSASPERKPCGQSSGSHRVSHPKPSGQPPDAESQNALLMMLPGSAACRETHLARRQIDREADRCGWFGERHAHSGVLKECLQFHGSSQSRVEFSFKVQERLGRQSCRHCQADPWISHHKRHADRD
jgi:hypothetical protein